MRYLKLYRHFVKFSLIQAMQFRFDFFYRIIMDAAFYLTSILFFKIIFTQTEGLVGWTEPQVMIFVSGFLFMDAIQMTFFNNGLWMIPVLVNKGELDYYLLRPVSSLFFLTTREFAINSVVNIIMAIGIMIWAFTRYPDPLSVVKIIGYLLLILTGCYLYLMIRILTVLPVFWTHNGRGLEVIFWTLEKFAEKPHMIYKGWIQRVLLTIIPFALLCSVPAQFLFQESSWSLLFYCIAVTVIFHFVIRLAWARGLREYSSASS